MHEAGGEGQDRAGQAGSQVGSFYSLGPWNTGKTL